MAPTVLVGAGPPEGVASVNNWPQTLESPAMPPVEFTQAARMSPSVWRVTLEAEKNVGRVAPGTAPLVVLVYSFTVKNAVCNCDASLEPEPTLAYAVMKFVRAAAVPIVVSSFRTM